MTSVITLLFIAQTTAEWVEISQQHYRKPIRTHSIFTASDRVTDVEDTTKPWAYNNHSVTEYNWNKRPERPLNTGNVRRVQLFGSTVKTTDRVKFEEYPELDVDVIELRPNYGTTKATTEINEKGQQKGMIERVPNLGNIKRFQLVNTPVKSPAVNFKGDKEKYFNNRPKNNRPDEDLQTEVTEFEDRKTKEPFVRRIYVNKGKKHSNDMTTPPDDEDMFFAENINTLNKKPPKHEYRNQTAVKNVYSTTMSTFITKSGDVSSEENRQNKFYKVNNRKPSGVTEKVKIFATEQIDDDEDIVILNNKQKTELTTEKTDKNMNEDKTESVENKVTVSGNEEHLESPSGNTRRTNTKSKNTAPKQDSRSKNVPHKDKKDGRPNEDPKIHTMENVVKFMRVVADTISSNSRRSFGGKMQYLHDLKDTILANIEDRIDSTWPDDDSAGARRYSRSAQSEPRGHVHIPSSESALMTISFLTFAVFLIKLVLQVIHTYKHKAMMYAPVVVAASGRNVFSRNGRH